MRVFLLSGLFVFFLSAFAFGQNCAPPQIIANAKTDNIFSPEQEMILGEITLQRLSTEFRPLRDTQLLAYVETIGNNLLKHFPDTGLKYTFHIIDYPEANAFNIPGGHVFLSRKLIAFANSEDEIASVIAHELGHAVVRHGSQDMTAAMKRVLNVTSVGDRKDIIDKYNRLIENARTKRAPARRGHENEQQLEADKLGFFATVAAGYDPNASFTFYDRMTESDGKTGSWFSDLFGNTKPEQKRLREIVKATEQLPKECRDGRLASATENFLHWQAAVVRYREAAREESIPGLVWKKEIDPKIRSDVNRLKFSNDGKYLLVIDDFAVTILERDPAKVFFQIPTENTTEAFFTEDNSEIVLLTGGLRFERWNIREKEALEIRELVIRSNCWEESLSPDGRFLACIDQTATINIIETKSGKKVFEKKKFYELSMFEYITWLFRSSQEDSQDVGFFRIGFSPDSKYVLFSRSNKHRFRIRIDGMTADQSENTAFAVETATMKQISPKGSLKKLASRPYVFIEPDKILGNPESKLEAGGVFSFPEGKRLSKVEFASNSVGKTANSRIVTVKPLKDTTIGLYDIVSSKIITGMNKNDIAVWEDIIAFEAASGKILFRKLEFDANGLSEGGTDIASVDIPVASMNNLRSSEVSDDFSWASLSTKTRGGIWNLKTGERKIFTRGFIASVVDSEGNSIALFPKLGKEQPQLAFLTGATGEAKSIGEVPEHGTMQYGRFVLKRTNLETEKSGKQTQTFSVSDLTNDNDTAPDLSNNVRFEIVDMLKNVAVWSKDFKAQAPRHSFDSFSGRLIFYWQLSSEAGKLRLQESPNIAARAAAMPNNQNNYLIDVIDAYKGSSAGSVLIDTGRGSFGIGLGRSERDWLVLRDSEGRILVYSISQGDLKHRFFGTRMAMSPASDQIFLETMPGHVGLFNLVSGEKIVDFTINGELSFGRFSLDGKRLLLFSNQQVAYSIDLANIKPIEKKIVF